MTRSNFSKHLYGLFIFICVISLFHVFSLAAEGSSLAKSAAGARAKADAGSSGSAWATTGSLNLARYDHTATQLQDGTVLVAGGYDYSQGDIISTCEIYNPSSGAWTQAAVLNTSRYLHTATLLNDHTVLVIGGTSDGSTGLTECEIYSPKNGGSWTTVGSLTTGRFSHTATLLNDGTVLVAGGLESTDSPTSDCEIYNPSTQTWSPVGSLATARSLHTATLLNDGTVLVAGGLDSSDKTTALCEIYNPVATPTPGWTTTGPLAAERSHHTATLLQNGQVLVAGGFGTDVFDPLIDSEIYDPVNKNWTETAGGGLNSARFAHTATLLPDGTVLVAGGTGYDGDDLNSCEIYEPSTGGWNQTFPLLAARAYYTATFLSVSGYNTVLVAGGLDGTTVLAESEIFTPNTSTSAPSPPTITGVTPGSGLATVNFTIPASTGGSPITSYTATPSPGTVPPVTVPGSSVTSITVSGLTNGTSYTFTVTAANAIGTSSPSAQSSPVTPAAKPDPPTGVTATPYNASASVSFNPPASNGGSAITLYTVTSYIGTVATVTATGTVSPITVSGLLNATPYTFTVTATNAIGSTASSQSSPVTPYTIPGAPTITTVTPGNAQAIVNFTAPATNGSAITSYTATSNPGNVAVTVAGSSVTSITVSGLTNATSYTFTVTATNAAGQGPASAPSSLVTPYTVPGAPTGVTAQPGNASASVSFTYPASNGNSITSYTVTSNPGGKTASGATCPITVSGLTNGTSYTFTAIAANAAGQSLASTASNPVTPDVLPGAPTKVTATAGNGEATVSFKAPAPNGGSAITGYTVTPSPGTVSPVTVAGSSVTSITVLGLTNGTAYTFTVTAANEAGSGPASGSSNSVTPESAPTAPGAPAAVAAVAGNAMATVNITPGLTGGMPITAYTVTSSPGNIKVKGTSSQITVKGLVNGTQYTFMVAATNKVGTGPGISSNSVTPSTVPAAPTKVTATPGAPSTNQATVSFTAPASNGSPITGYTVTSKPGGITATGTASPITVSGLTFGTAYTFTVTATNTDGTGKASAASNSATPYTVPGPPVNVTAKAGNAEATVSFKAPASNGSAITSYTVTSPEDSSISVTGKSSPITVKGLTTGTSYTFTVTATNKAGTGAQSIASGLITAK